MRDALVREKSMHRKTGFTLFEILVTMAIIGILLGSVLVSASSIESERKMADMEIMQIEAALDSYFNKYGLYPPGGFSSAEDSGVTMEYATYSGLAPVLRSVPDSRALVLFLKVKPESLGRKAWFNFNAKRISLIKRPTVRAGPSMISPW